MSLAFAPFSTSHWAAITIGGLGIALLVRIGRRGGAGQLWTTGGLAWVSLAAFPLTQIAWSLGGDLPNLESSLPLQLCDVAAVVAGFALLTRRPTLCELTYFWGLSASVQGVLTPAISYDFPHPVFCAFFIHHLAIVAAAIYLPVVLGWRPRRPLWRTIVRVLLWSEVYIIIMLPLNSLLGTNFGFLNGKPANPSLLDHLGPWPLYLLSIQVVGIAAICLLTLPFARRAGTHAAD
jgi:hypothetical integral membrane protein (TIGR02206 family)